MKVSDADIIYAYNNFSTKEALEYLGISKSAYYKRLNKLNIDLNKVVKIPDYTIIDSFKSSKSIREAAQKVGLSAGAYYKRMIKLGLDFTDKHDTRKYKVNDDAFTELNDEVAYWIGYIAADGAIVGNKISFYISAKDIDILENIRYFLKSDNPIHSHKTYTIDASGNKKELDAIHLRITSNKIVNELAKYGIVQSKTYKDIDFISYIPYKYKLSFIFGIFDGDGSISTGSNNVITLSGNHNSIYSICDYLSKINITSSLSVRDSISVAYITKRDSIQKFAEAYIEFSKTHKVLNRKKKIALDILHKI